MKILFAKKDYIIDPLGIGFLSSAIKKAGHNTDIIKTDVEDVFNKIKEYKPNIIAYSILTGSHKYFLELNKKIKQKFPNIISVFGNAHCTFFGESVIKKSGVDYICCGEGEEAFLELIKAMESRNDTTKIKNIWSKNKDTIYKNPMRPLVENLDSIPHPDRELLYKYQKNKNNYIRNVYFIRFCPYKCSYCFNEGYNELYNNHRLRATSVEYAIEEMEQIKRDYPNTRMMYFQEDILPLDKEWFTSLMGRYKERISLPFHCHIRPNLINRETIKILKSAGCYSITTAFENGNEYIRNKVLNRGLSREIMLEGARIIREANIKLRIENMIGVPYETVETAMETLGLNIEAKPTIGWASVYCPFPGTKLAELATKEKMFDGNVDKIEEYFFGNSVLVQKDQDKLDNLQKLFSITVSFPFLKKFIPILIKLPKNKFYVWIFKYWKKRLYDKWLYNV